MSNISSFRTSAASNNSAPPDGFPEGMAPSAVNDAAREVMAALARWYSDTDGTLTTGGTGNAYTLTSNSSHAALADQSLLVFRVDRANTGAATLNVDSLGAKAVRLGGTALVSGTLVADKVYMVAYNATDGAYDLIAGVDHDQLPGFVSAEHVDHSGVSITAGSGLTGGGTIESTRTVNVGAGTGITVNANDVALNTSSSRNTDHNSVSITAGSGLSGGGTIASSRTLSVNTGNGLEVVSDDVRMSGSYSGTFTATEVQATSDLRLKEGVETITNAMTLLDGLRGTHYFHSTLERNQFGVIAQEVQKVMPEAVGKGEDGYLSVSYAQITALLVEVCKGLAERVEALEGRG